MLRRLRALPVSVAAGRAGSCGRPRWTPLATRGLHDGHPRQQDEQELPSRKRRWSPYLQLSPAVAAALAAGGPVVALESTIITHGMPYPANLATAREVEAIVRDEGATPATVAILDGKLCVGLEEAQLEALAQAGRTATKCSRRDIPLALATGKVGSTTVASTLYVARMAGLEVFVTGGIGGVHRAAEATMDVSADLVELGRTPGVAVVCAGVKSILDIAKTLEVLETQGVPVLAYGTDAFPAFFTPDSGLPAPARVDTPREAAAVLRASQACRLPASVLVAVPNPAPAQAQQVQAAIEGALREAEARGLRGKDVTPFILQRVNEATGGESLRANIELVKNNAKVGARIAGALAQARAQARARAGAAHRSGGSSSSRSSRNPSGGGSGSGRRGYSTTAAAASAAAASATTDAGSSSPPRVVVVVGGAVMDVVGSPRRGFKLEAGTSTPGAVRQKEGGVGRNVAEGLARLGVPTALVTAVGDDPAGVGLAASLRALGPALDTAAVLQLPGERTASCVAMLDERSDLAAAIADMDIFAHLTPQRLRALLRLDAAKDDDNLVARARLVVADGNLTVEAFQALAAACARHGVPLLFEPTSVAKAGLPCQAHALHRVTVLKPNLRELGQLAWVLQGRHGHGVRLEEEEGRLEQLFEELLEAGEKARDGDGMPRAEDILRIVRPSLELVLRAMTTTTTSSSGDGGGRAVGWKGEKHVLVTMGAHGLVWGKAPAQAAAAASAAATAATAAAGEPLPGFEARYFPARPVKMVDSTGAGDTLVAAVVAGLVSPPGGGQAGDMGAAIELGMAAARRSVQVREAIPRDLSLPTLVQEVHHGTGGGGGGGGGGHAQP